MLNDRLGDVKFVDKATEFKLSPEWRRQWGQFIFLIDRLYGDAMQGREFNDLLDLSDAEQNYVANNVVLADYDIVTCPAWTCNQAVSALGRFPYIDLKRVRSRFLSFNRKANYEWAMVRVDKAVLDYQSMRERLIGYEELELPELVTPKIEESFVTPFVKEAAELIDSWLTARYDHRRQITITLPTPVLLLNHNGGITMEKVELYNARFLFDSLYEIHNKYSIEDAYARAMAAVHGIKTTYQDG